MNENQNAVMGEGNAPRVELGEGLRGVAWEDYWKLKKELEMSEAVCEGLREQRDDADEQRDKFKSERDELLAAAKSAHDVLRRDATKGADSAQLRLGTAIAKAEGNK